MGKEKQLALVKEPLIYSLFSIIKKEGVKVDTANFRPFFTAPFKRHLIHSHHRVFIHRIHHPIFHLHIIMHH